jgi:ribosome biogenesis protein YTM1
LRRYALSTLVNNLLETEKPIPFEFLINGTFLRTTIDEYLTANGLSSESTLNVEYVRALIPPTHAASFEHDDWVSAVDIYSSPDEVAPWVSSEGPSRDDERILSGSYDGLLRMWTPTSKLVATSQPVSRTIAGQAIKTVRFLTHSKIVSAGNDRTLRLWDYNENGIGGTDENSSGEFTPILELYGHRSSIDSVAVHAQSDRILSASSDHSVGIWTSRKSEAPPAPDSLLPTAASKRRKLDSAISGNTLPQRGPLRMLKGHSGPVTGVIFSATDATVGYSCSWDHTILTWDLVTGTEVSPRRTLHPLLCLTELPDLGVLVTGSTARHLSIVDPRADARDISGMTLRGHKGAVSSIAAEPGKAWGLVSGSHDGTCRIWDLRSVRMDGTTAGGLAPGSTGQVCDSVYVISRESTAKSSKVVSNEGIKVFTVGWDAEVGIVSSGEDKRVQVNRALPR